MILSKAKAETVKVNPFKYVESDQVLQIRCLVQYIDFEGRCDCIIHFDVAKSLYNILQHVSPKKLIIIGAPKHSTLEMQEYCMKSKAITDDIMCPMENEMVNVSTATNLYQVVLTDSLVSSLRLSQVILV